MKRLDIENIEPKEVLKWFKIICSIPHGSFKEGPLADKLTGYLTKAGCKVEKLSSGALHVMCPATKGHENWPITMLQGHMDMVHVVDAGIKIDMAKEPVPVFYDEEHKWLKAEGTTLGADNGVALAMFMEIFTNPNIEHGPLEGLFTVGEEEDTQVCMKSITPGLLKAKYFINLDSPEDDTIFYASAGGARIPFEINFKTKPADANTVTYRFDFKNFSGGHSALDIHHPRLNSIILMSRILIHFILDGHKLNLISINGGSAANSIPTFVTSYVQIDKNEVKELEKLIDSELKVSKESCQGFEDDATYTFEKVEDVKTVIDDKSTKDILTLFACVQNGMLLPSEKGHCMFNSSNVGLIKTTNDKIESVIMPRSFIHDDINYIVKTFKVYLKHFNAHVIKAVDSCGCWLVKDHMNSKLVQTWFNSYKTIVGKEPYVRPNPGGLEVAEIVLKAPQCAQNAISVGPYIYREHTTLENCPTESINKVWKILQLTLRGLNK